jgi:hypothetical protein
LLHGRCSASSLLWTPPTPSRLPPTSRCRRLYGFPAPPLSRRDEEGLSSCLACPCHRAVALTPPEWVAASVSLRRSMLSSLYGSELDLWCFRLSRPNLRLLSLRPDDLLTIRKMALSIGFRNSVSLLFAIQATRLLTFASVGLSPTEHSSLSWTHFRKAGFPRYGFKAGISGGAFPAARVFPAVGLPSPFVLLAYRVLLPALCRGTRCAGAPPFEWLPPLYPRDPRSGPGYVVPVHHHLTGPMRPTPRHITTSPSSGLYVMPSLCVLPRRLGDPRVDPCFR